MTGSAFGPRTGPDRISCTVPAATKRRPDFLNYGWQSRAHTCLSCATRLIGKQQKQFDQSQPTRNHEPSNPDIPPIRMGDGFFSVLVDLNRGEFELAQVEVERLVGKLQYGGVRAQDAVEELSYLFRLGYTVDDARFDRHSNSGLTRRMIQQARNMAWDAHSDLPLLLRDLDRRSPTPPTRNRDQPLQRAITESIATPAPPTAATMPTEPIPGNKSCAVCFEGTAQMLLCKSDGNPSCGCVCMCEYCAHELAKTTPNRDPMCPRCRAPYVVSKLFKLFVQQPEPPAGPPPVTPSPRRRTWRKPTPSTLPASPRLPTTPYSRRRTIRKPKASTPSAGPPVRVPRRPPLPSYDAATQFL